MTHYDPSAQSLREKTRRYFIVLCLSWINCYIVPIQPLAHRGRIFCRGTLRRQKKCLFRLGISYHYYFFFDGELPHGEKSYSHGTLWPTLTMAHYDPPWLWHTMTHPGYGTLWPTLAKAHYDPPRLWHTMTHPGYGTLAATGPETGSWGWLPGGRSSAPLCRSPPPGPLGAPPLRSNAAPAACCP